MSDVFKDFVGQYALDRTISMRLKPKTREDQDEEMFWSEFLEDKDDDTPAVLKNDKLRAIAYPVVKRCLDQMHKMFIEQALFYADIDWQPLLMSYAKCNSKLENILKCNFEDAIESAEPIVDAQGIYRGKIIDILTKHPWWSSIEKGNQKIFQDVLPQLISNEGFINEVKIGLKDEELPNYTKPRLEEQIGLFSKGFTMYFNKYKKNRDNMYSEKDQDTAIANRLVNENFSKYADNFIVYHRLKDLCQEELSLVEAEVLPLLSELGLSCIADLFKANSYNLLLIQKRIDIYNQIIGRLNSLGNESWSQKKPKNLKRKDFLMSTLFKQILSDRVRPSYLPEQFAEGEKGFEELLTSIAKFYDSLMSGYLDELERVLSTIKETDADLSHIYISGKNISTLSNKLYGDWNVLAETIRDNKIGQKTKKNKKDKEDLTKPIEKWSEDQIISIQDIKDVECQIQKATTQDAISFLSSFKIIKKKDEKTECIDILQRVCSNYVNKWNVLLEQYNAGQLNKDNAKNVIKEILDDLQTVNRYCKLFNLGKHEGKYEKATFYTELESLQASSVQYPVVISEIEPLYNKVSAYMKRKDYIKGKMLVKFDCSTLAKGWNSSAFIVIKDNKFYVVIDNGIDEEDWLRVKKDTDASRVVYSQQKMDFKNFPRLFLFSKGDNEAPAVQQYGLPINNVKTEYLYYRSLSQSRKKAYLEVHKDFQTRLIKYYMTCITRHESTKPYSATLKKAWKNPEEYQNLQEFYDDCDCCYSLSSESINLSELINLSRERKAFVFQLYNKDFAEKANGKENLHTMYWRELFSPENLKDVVFKLSSEGTELFYRAKHAGRQTVHKKGEFVVNKVLKNGNPIPNDVFLLYKQNLRNGVIDLSNVHVDENDEKAKKTLTNAKNLLAEDFVKEPHQLNVDIQKKCQILPSRNANSHPHQD